MNTPKSQGADRASCIDAYIEANAVLFPLSNNRTPQEVGWQFVTETPDPLPECYGYLIPTNVFVIDYDPRLETTSNTNQLARFSAEVSTPETFTVETPRGGVHLYYQYPGSWDLSTRLGGHVPGYKAVEIKQHRQYVVGAGSVAKTGVYAIVGGSPDRITIAPPDLLAALRPRVGEKPEANIDIEFDSETSVQWFIKYLHMVSTEQSAFVTACKGKDKGLLADTIARLMFDHINPRWNIPATIEELQHKAANAYRFGQNKAGSTKRTEDFKDVDLKGLGIDKLIAGVPWDWEVKNGLHVLRPNMHNVACYFQVPEIRSKDDGSQIPNPLYGLLAYNVLSHKLEFRKQAPWHQKHEKISHWRDIDTLMLKNWFFNSQHFRINKIAVEEGVEVVAHTNQIHPIRGWLEECENSWDQIARVDAFFIDTCWAYDNIYVRDVARTMFIGLVDRIMRPGCKHDTMVVLEGKQGIGKSGLVKWLGGEFAGSMTLDPNNTQRNLHRMLGKWVIEIPEMEFTRWSESDIMAIKAFLSIEEDYDYLRYERYAKTLPRQSIFIGTMNPNERGYLRDVTGNRRFHPIRLRTVVFEMLTEENRRQLFGEAVSRWRKGEKHYFTDPEVLRQSAREQEARQFTDMWEDVVAVGLAERTDKTHWLNVEIVSQILHMPVSRSDQKALHRISNVMVKLGWVQEERWNDQYNRKMKMWRRAESRMEMLWS